MKLMKHIMIALVLCAIPAVAGGQTTTTCPGCTHVAPIYMGEGGFIAMAADGVEKVNWLSRCGSGVARGGELTANDDGMVSALWTENNGLACMAEDGGSFEVGPVMDGGWYWITDEKSSAVGNLVGKDALDNDAVKIVSAGDGVTMTTGKGAVYLKETATGRVGILPNIMPRPPLRKCGYAVVGTTLAKASFQRLASDCALGDGGTTMALYVEGPFPTGTSACDSGTESNCPSRLLPPGGRVVRPANGVMRIRPYLWMNGTGHFVTATDGDPRLGQMRFQNTPQRLDSSIPMSLRVYAIEDGSQPLLITSAGKVKGIDWSGSSASNRRIDITHDAAYCGSGQNFSLPVRIELSMISTERTVVTPPIKSLGKVLTGASASGEVVVARADFTIVCPSGSGAASAHQGEELVPENPFPVQ